MQRADRGRTEERSRTERAETRREERREAERPERQRERRSEGAERREPAHPRRASDEQEPHGPGIEREQIPAEIRGDEPEQIPQRPEPPVRDSQPREPELGEPPVGAVETGARPPEEGVDGEDLETAPQDLWGQPGAGTGALALDGAGVAPPLVSDPAGFSTEPVGLAPIPPVAAPAGTSAAAPGAQPIAEVEPGAAVLPPAPEGMVSAELPGRGTGGEQGLERGGAREPELPAEGLRIEATGREGTASTRPASERLEVERTAASERPEARPAAADVERAARILRQIRTHLSGEVRHATLQLAPAELGRVAIRLALRRGHMAAVVRAESPETLDLLERHLPELRATLAGAGIEAESFELELGSQEQGEDFERELRAPRLRARGPSATDPRADDARQREHLAPRAGRVAADAVDIYA